MNAENQKNQNCSCDTNCCQPKKSKTWMKIVFFAVVIAAISIVTYKMANPTAKASTQNAKSSCCDSTSATACKGDSTKISGCEKTK